MAETDVRALAEQRPSNAWTATLDKTLTDDALRKEFMLQCGFCHQQGSAFLRRERSASEWSTAIKRMVHYGSRLSSQAQQELPALLEKHWQNINAHPELVPAATPWAPYLAARRSPNCRWATVSRRCMTSSRTATAWSMWATTWRTACTR